MTELFLLFAGFGLFALGHHMGAREERYLRQAMDEDDALARAARFNPARRGIFDDRGRLTTLSGATGVPSEYLTRAMWRARFPEPTTSRQAGDRAAILTIRARAESRSRALRAAANN